MKIIRKLKHKAVAGINSYTDYLLQTTPEQRKAERKTNRALRRAKRLKSLREFKPFNWRFLQKWQDRSIRRAELNRPITVE